MYVDQLDGPSHHHETGGATAAVLDFSTDFPSLGGGGGGPGHNNHKQNNNSAAASGKVKYTKNPNLSRGTEPKNEVFTIVL